MKKIKKEMNKSCVVCGKKINVVLYTDSTYKGGHYFGRIPIPGNNKAEYWECEKCYVGDGKS
jgi:hypothetical protein